MLGYDPDSRRVSDRQDGIGLTDVELDPMLKNSNGDATGLFARKPWRKLEKIRALLDAPAAKTEPGVDESESASDGEPASPVLSLFSDSDEDEAAAEPPHNVEGKVLTLREFHSEYTRGECRRMMVDAESHPIQVRPCCRLRLQRRAQRFAFDSLKCARTRAHSTPVSEGLEAGRHHVILVRFALPFRNSVPPPVR
jgi:hypothetical protein